MDQIDSPDIPPASPPAKRGILRNVTFLLLGVTILALTGAVVYLLSDLNQRQYRLNSQGNMLVVEQGKFFPIGFELYVPKDASLQPIYAPIQLPKDTVLEPSEIFEDRTDVDRAIFGLLSGWSRQKIDSKEPEDFTLAVNYIERCENLPGLTEEQRKELKIFRADIAFKSGLVTLKGIAHQLNNALKQFQLSIELGTTHAEEANAWIKEIQKRIDAYKSSTTPQPEGSLQNTVTPKAPINIEQPQNDAEGADETPPTPESPPSEPTQEKWQL